MAGAFPWTLAAVAGTSVCLRRVEAEPVFDLIRRHKVTHFCGAPVVHNMLINAPAELRAGIGHKVSAMIAGAAPPQAVIEGMERMGVDLTHVYGLTEVYGPASRVRQTSGVGVPAAVETRGTQRQAGRALRNAGRHGRARPEDHAAGGSRRADHGRDLLPRQHHDEGLPQESAGDRGSLRGRLVPHRRPGGDRRATAM